LNEAESIGFTWPHAAAIVVATGTPDQRRWAIEEAIELVRRLAADHPKVVVVDLLSGGDSVASLVDVAGGPGIVDVFFRGASFSSVARRPESERFFFLPMGTAPPSREILYKHPGWAKVASRLADANAFLVPCVAADDWLDAGPIAGFESCVVINALGVDVPLPDRAVLLSEFQPAPEPATEVTVEPVGEPVAEEVTLSTKPAAAEPVEEVEPEPAAVPDVEVAPLQLPPEVGSPRPGGRVDVGDTPVIVAPGRSSPAQPKRSKRGLFGSPRRTSPKRPKGSKGSKGWHVGPVFAALAIVLLAFTLWKAWQDGFFVRELALMDDVDRQVQPEAERLQAASDQAGSEPGEQPAPVTPEAAPATEQGAAVSTPAEPAAAGSRAGELTLGYSVAVASFRSMDDAVAQIDAYSRSDISFYVAPTVVRNVVWYRVLAGVLATKEEAAGLMRTLVGDGIKGAVNNWDVRPSWLAFRFGTYPNLHDAQSTVDTLQGLGISAYLVPAAGRGTGPDQAYHVYAGGYDTEAAARPLADQIARAGLEAELVERLGVASQ
jgi:septal ring-binding cell division protein DamX